MTSLSLTALCRKAVDPNTVYTAVKELPFDGQTLTVVCRKALRCHQLYQDLDRCESVGAFIQGRHITFKKEDQPKFKTHYSIWKGFIITLINRGAKADPNTLEAIKLLGDEELTQKVEKAFPHTLTELCKTVHDPLDVSSAIANQHLTYDNETLTAVCERALTSLSLPGCVNMDYYDAMDFYEPFETLHGHFRTWRLLIIQLTEKGATTDLATAAKIKKLGDEKLSQTIDQALTWWAKLQSFLIELN